MLLRPSDDSTSSSSPTAGEELLRLRINWEIKALVPIARVLLGECCCFCWLRCRGAILSITRGSEFGAVV
jgi:hypothetical protein